LSSTTKANIRESFEHDHEHENLIYLSSTDATEYWNLFAEIEREADIDEIGRALFPQTDGSEFFSQAGRQLFVAVVTYLHREAQASDTTPTNADLVAFVQSTDKQEMHERLTDHSDLTAAASSIDRIRNDRLRACTRTSSKLSLTSSAVTSLLRRGVLDSGIYGRSTGTDVAVDFPITEGDAVQPAFRFFIDWAARFALADDQDTYFVLDEFARLPGLRKIGDLINAGRGETPNSCSVCSRSRNNSTTPTERPGERAVEWPRPISHHARWRCSER